jgi:hypothetical protein
MLNRVIFERGVNSSYFVIEKERKINNYSNQKTERERRQWNCEEEPETTLKKHLLFIHFPEKYLKLHPERRIIY